MLDEGPVLGAKVPRTQMAPSSRCGKNSDPTTPLKNRKSIKAPAADAHAERNFQVIKAPIKRLCVALPVENEGLGYAIP